MKCYEGTLDRIPDIDENLRMKNLRGLLIGGLARLANRVPIGSENNGGYPARKDIDVMILDQTNQEFPGLDAFRRYRPLPGSIGLPHENRAMPFPHPYWVNGNDVILDFTLPNVDAVSLKPGLHIADRVFLTRLYLLKLMDSKYSDRPLQEEVIESDLFHPKLIIEKIRRACKGNLKGVKNLDSLKIRPLTAYELYCLSHDLSGHRLGS